MSMNDTKNPRSISGYLEGLEEAKNIPSGFCNEVGYSTLEEASKYSETGKFQLLLLLVSIIGIFTTSAFPTLINLKVNVLICQYSLTYENRKVLNYVVCTCLIMGGITSSMIADTMSRKWTLIFNLLINAVASAAISLTTNFKQFLYLRALISFSSSSITAIIVTHLSEFLLPYYRGSVIASLQIGWLLGTLTIPFLTNYWRYQAAFTVIPSLLSAFLFLFFPESPRFLLSRGRSSEALLSLQFIFSVNTGKSKTEYPIRHLIDNKNPSSLRRRSVIKHYVSPGLEPKFICIPIIMLSQFMFMFSYCTVTFWFPIMNQRLPGIFPLIDDVEIPQDCTVGFIVVPPPLVKGWTQKSTLEMRANHPNLTKVKAEETHEKLCNMKSDPMFNEMHTMTNVITCMPVMIFIVLKIDSIGRKFFIMMAHFIAACLTYVSFFMHTHGKDLLYASAFDSVFIIAVAVAQCLAVEVFPTRFRVFGVAVVLAAGSVGVMYAASGGILVYDLPCIVLLAICGIGLEVTGIIIMTLPSTAGINLR